jgi:hypothetical protein
LSEEEAATLFVQMMPRIATGRESSEIGLLKVVPAVLSSDQAEIRTALGKVKDQGARTDFYIKLIKTHIERGGKASEGKKKDDPDGTGREGWTGNPCYHAALMPTYVRVFEHFDLPFRQKEYHQSILRFSDFSLEVLGGDPLDDARLSKTLRQEWPSRVVPLIPLSLHAYTLKKDEKYARAATVVFNDLYRLVERNPHGYFPAWTFNPQADRYDTVYNPVSYERGITAFWADEQLKLIGRDKASAFVTAQARWFVYSGQLLDSLETDNATAIRASTHGGHTNLRNQIGIYLYDDFAFYRGLIGDLAMWSAAASQVPGPVDDSGVGPYRNLTLSNGGSSMLRWALDIRPGSNWKESRVEPMPKGFRVQAWNRMPREKPAFVVKGPDAGVKSAAEVMHIELHGPAYRQPAEFETTWTADRIALKVSKPARIRLAYAELQPEWPKDARPTLYRVQAGAPAKIVEAVSDKGSLQWNAIPGEYELRSRSN